MNRAAAMLALAFGVFLTLAATRALAGFKVINLGAIADPAERRRIAQTHEPAGGWVFFWVPSGSES